MFVCWCAERKIKLLHLFEHQREKEKIIPFITKISKIAPSHLPQRRGTGDEFGLDAAVLQGQVEALSAKLKVIFSALRKVWEKERRSPVVKKVVKVSGDKLKDCPSSAGSWILNASQSGCESLEPPSPLLDTLLHVSGPSWSDCVVNCGRSCGCQLPCNVNLTISSTMHQHYVSLMGFLTPQSCSKKRFYLNYLPTFTPDENKCKKWCVGGRWTANGTETNDPARQQLLKQHGWDAWSRQTHPGSLWINFTRKQMVYEWMYLRHIELSLFFHTVFLPVITTGASPSSGCQDSLASHPHFHCFPEPASGLFTGWYSRYFHSEGGIFWRSGSAHTMPVWTEAMSSCRCGDYKEAALLPEIRARGIILSRWETNQRTGLWGGLSIVGVPGTREEIAAASCSRSCRNLTF